MAYTNKDLIMPSDPNELEKLIGNQGDNAALRTIGIGILSMVAIHFGGYALKNAGVKLLTQHLSDVRLLATRPTTIAEDLLGIGKKLDRYSAEQLGRITDTTSLGAEFRLRAKARAAQHVKRLPYEFIPAWAVQTTMRPKTESEKPFTYHLRTIGETVLGYAAADILVGPALKFLGKTQYGQSAQETMRRVSPGALKFVQEQLDKAIIGGHGSARAVGAMYREWEALPQGFKIPTPRNLKRIWDEEGSKAYKAGIATLHNQTHESQLPWFFKVMREQSEHAVGIQSTAKQASYIQDWTRSLVTASELAGRPVLPSQAKALYNAINIGQDTRASYRAVVSEFNVIADNAPWFARFGHTENTFKFNQQAIQQVIDKEIPQLRGLDAAGVNRLLHNATEATDAISRGGWVAPGYAHTRIPPSFTASSDDLPGGILQEQSLYRYYAYNKQKISMRERKLLKHLGLRHQTWGEWGTGLRRQAADPDVQELLKEYDKVNRAVAASSEGGMAGRFYQNWQNLPMDRGLLVRDGAIGAGTSDVINFVTARGAIFNAVRKLEGTTQLPILNFNPLQLIQWKERMKAPESNWLGIGSFHPGLGRIIETPHLQMGDRILSWEGRRTGDFVAGRFQALPGKYKAYSTSYQSTTGRLVRNILGLGQDEIKRYDEEKSRWLYGGERRSKVARALGVSEFTSGSIGNYLKNLVSGTPLYAFSQRYGAKYPRAAGFAYNKVSDIYWPKELDKIISAPGTTTPDEISRVLNQVSSMLHPSIPRAAMSDLTLWLPGVYRQAGFKRTLAHTGQVTDVPGLTTSALIGNVVSGKAQLLQVIDVLEADARAQSRLGGNTYQLYRNVLRNVKRDLISYTRSGSPGAAPLDARQFGRGYYNVEDKAQRSIINYLLARPTTMVGVTGPRNLALNRMMQISELDTIVNNISSVRGYGEVITGEIKGAVASLKLLSYKANYYNNPTAMAEAIAIDTSLLGEVRASVTSWAKAPFGRGWRTPAPDVRNARVVLNRFSDKHTYLEKFSSAFARNPAGAISGIFTGGGTPTGISMAAYHTVNRLRAVLRLVGLDFPEGKYTNMSDLLVGGFFLRRILPGMAAVEAYRYLDWQSDKKTGTGITEAALKYGVVQPTVTGASLSDALGFREAASWFGKVTGEEDRMNALKYLTMTGTEMRQFWEEGETPVRRGRWWPLSNTPYEGGRTIAWIPNLYRRVQSRYQYTWEGGRGPEDFYFGRSWLPNPSYPLAPLNRLTDPYAFEKATYYSRPYPLTGDFFNAPSGPLNPVLNATLGQLIKPTKTMHPGAAGYMAAGVTQYGVPLEGVNWGMPLTGARMAHAQIASANSKVVGQAMAGGAVAGQPYGIGYSATELLMGQVGVPMNVVYAATPPGIWTTPVQMGNMKDTAYRFQEMAGIYGFGIQSVRTMAGLAGEYTSPSYLPKASEAYSFQSAFWNMHIGGMGDFVLPGQSELSNITFSEIFRRFVPRQPTSVKVNPIANSVWQQNPWLPGPYSNYFEDFSVGDKFNRPYGALILPGEGYNRAYGTSPDYTRGMYPYGPIDRLRILSKAAPWSREYAAYNRSVAHMKLSPEDRRQYELIKAQVEDVSTKYKFAPYRFKGLDLEERNYEVMGISEEGYLSIRGLGTPVKLAGLTPGVELANTLRNVITPGARYDMTIDVNRPKFTYENDQRVLEAVVGGINDDLIDKGLSQEMGGSALSYFARTNPLERVIGSAWESFTHTWNPLTTKFIQRRTALEHYERTQVYSVDYAPWTQPYESFIRPMVESAGAKSFLGSITTGAVLGRLTGRGPGKAVMSAVGGTTLGLSNLRAKAHELLTGNAWIPGHVKERWEQEEYMDTLQYVAAARNYSLLRRRAIAAGEQDPESIWQRDQSVRSWLAERKRNISASLVERSVYGGVSKKEYFANNPISEQAYTFREQMGKTLYGANLSGDYLSLQRAIPKERRMFFEQFLNAPIEDRERILELLPKAERRLYEAAWGMKIENKPRLSDYFEENYLPGPEAAIWGTSVDWEKVRVRMIERAGGDPSKYGYYPQEVTEAEMYPIPVPTPDTSQIQNIKDMLSQILGGSPIEGLSILVEPSADPGFNLEMNVTRDMYSYYDEMVGKRMGAL